jgi:hypothetical protein
VGRSEGRIEGRSEGRIEGSRDVFTVILEREFGKLPPRIYKRVLRATQPDIDLWLDRLKTGASLKKIFS